MSDIKKKIKQESGSLYPRSMGDHILVQYMPIKEKSSIMELILFDAKRSGL